MRKTIIEALVKGALSKSRNTQKYWLDAFENATDMEWEASAAILFQANREIALGYRNLNRWWTAIMVKRALAAHPLDALNSATYAS